MEEVDFGYTSHAYHIFDLYHEMLLISDSEKNFLVSQYPFIKENAILDVKVSRLEFLIEEAVSIEDFKKAKILKDELDMLK